jgi:hypothetical protein
MERPRLGNLQQPSGVEKLLESYVVGSGLLPKDARQILDRADMPRELRRIVILATRTGRVCACWADNAHTWLFTAEASLNLSRERGAPVLQVSRYGDDGTIEASGCWLADQKGTWHRCAD